MVDILMDRHCSECQTWLYNDYIEKKYGEGTGLCNGVPKGCDRAACLCFIERKKSEEK